MRVVKLAILSAVFVTAPTFAQVATQPAAPAAAPVKEKMVCRSEVPVGSIRAKRTCMTKRQWNELHGRNGAAAETALGNVRARADAGLSASQ